MYTTVPSRATTKLLFNYQRRNTCTVIYYSCFNKWNICLEIEFGGPHFYWSKIDLTDCK